MAKPAARFFSSLGAAVLFLLLFPAPASPQLTQPALILFGDPGTGYSGASVAVSGDTLAIGAPGYGTVWIHERNQGGAEQWGRVTAVNNYLYFDDTGADVDLSGDLLVAGNRFSIPFQGTGTVRIFERNRGGADFWGHVLALTASDPSDALFFGISVAVSGDTLAVGAGDHPSPSPSSPAGASVYLFERNQGGTDHWGQVRKVTLPEMAGSAVSVDLEGDRLIVGASRDEGRGTDAGAVYVFERNQGGAGQWGQTQKLTASDTAADHGFGTSVEISGNTFVVGAPGARAAYIFERGPGAWSEARKLSVSNANAALGWTVATDGDTVVVGAPVQSFFGPGDSAYVFRRHQGGPEQWGEAARLAARDSSVPVSVSGNVAVLGNPEWGELYFPETYVFNLAPLLLPEDVPALGPFGLAAMALLLVVAGCWMSGRERAKGSRPEGL